MPFWNCVELAACFLGLSPVAYFLYVETQLCDQN
jgi:hypothetical protein